MKICFVEDFVAPHFSGGASQYVSKLATAVQAAGHEVVMITTSPTTHQPSQRDWHGIRVYEVATHTPGIAVYGTGGWWSKAGNVARYWHNPAVHHQITTILNTEKPDLIHTHDTLYLSLSALAAVRQSGRPWLHTCHFAHFIKTTGLVWQEHHPDGPTVGWWRLTHGLTKRIVGSPQIVHGPSQFILSVHRQFGFFPASRQVVIPHGMFYQTTHDGLAKDRAPHILFVGRLHAEKDVATLIRSAQTLDARDLTVSICGDGPERATLEKLVAGDPRFHFYGHLQEAELTTLYQRANIFVASSLLYEPFNLTLVEAMSFGLPVIATNIGAHPEIVTPESGHLFPPHDASALTEILQRYVSNQDLRTQQSAAALERAKQFTFARHVAKMIATYSELVSPT